MIPSCFQRAQRALLNAHAAPSICQVCSCLETLAKVRLIGITVMAAYAVDLNDRAKVDGKVEPLFFKKETQQILKSEIWKSNFFVNSIFLSNWNSNDMEFNIIQWQKIRNWSYPTLEKVQVLSEMFVESVDCWGPAQPSPAASPAFSFPLGSGNPSIITWKIHSGEQINSIPNCWSEKGVQKKTWNTHQDQLMAWSWDGLSTFIPWLVDAQAIPRNIWKSSAVHTKWLETPIKWLSAWLNSALSVEFVRQILTITTHAIWTYQLWSRF